MLVVPILLFGVLGVSYSSVYERDVSGEQRESSRETEGREDGVGGKRSEAELHVKEEVQEDAIVGSEPVNQTQQVIRNAVENDDFEAFMKMAADTPFGDVMTEEAFDVLVKATQLHKEGDHAAVRNLMDGTGLIPPKNRGGPTSV